MWRNYHATSKSYIGRQYYTSLFLADYRTYNKLNIGRTIHDISVNETTNYPDVAIFYFNDGFPLDQFMGQASYLTYGEGFFDSGINYIYVVHETFVRDIPAGCN